MFLNIIIITTILLFVESLGAGSIGSLKNTAERDFHRTYRHHENLSNRNSPKACIKAENRFQHRKKVRENKEERHDYKDTTGPAWLKDPDFSMKNFSAPPSENGR